MTAFDNASRIRLIGHWASLLVFLAAGLFFLRTALLAWLVTPADTGRGLASLGLAALCLLQFGVLLAHRWRRDPRYLRNH